MSEIDPPSTARMLVNIQNGIVGMPLAPGSGGDIVVRAKDAVAVFRNAIHLLPVALALWTVPARAGTGTCSAAPAGVVRQDCLLAAVMPKPGGEDLTGSDLGSPVKAPLSDDAFRPVTAGDLAADPAAVLRRPVAVASARCFSFGVGDERCIVRGTVPVAVATAIVIPPEAEVAIERGCDPGDTSGCSRTIRFVPTSFRRTRLSGEDAVLFRTANVMVAPASVGDPMPRVGP